MVAGVLGLILVPAGAATGAAATAKPAAHRPAAAPKTLPIALFHTMVVDAAHGHLFFSQGYNRSTAKYYNDIVVTTLTGKLVTTIPGQDGVLGMVLSPDGTTLYASLATDDAVSAISTATLKETTRYPLGSGDSPYDVAVQSGKVWVSYFGTTGAAVGAIDPAASPASAFTPQALPGIFPSVTQLAADPENSGTLVTAVAGGTSTSVGTYDVATSPVTMYNPPTSSVSPVCVNNDSDLAVVPGGTQFIWACGGPYDPILDTATLKQTGEYPVASGPSVAIAPAGPQAGTIAIGADSAPQVLIYRPGGTTPVNKFEVTAGFNVHLCDEGLRWSADGATLFAVYETGEEGVTPVTFLLRAYHDPARTTATITLGGTRTAIRGRSVTITGRLSLSVGTPPAGSRITITRALAGSHAVLRWTRATAGGGTFSLTDTPRALGTYTYTASYPGTAALAPATASRQVTITRIPTALTVSASAGTVNYAARVTVTAHLGRTYTGRTVSIYARPFGSKKSIFLKTGRVDSRGTLSVSYAPAHSTTFSAVFGGDPRYQPATAMRNVYVRAGVTESISGYYTSEYIGGTLYRVYHHTAALIARATVLPGKRSGCVAFEVQEFAGGSWQPNTFSPCVPLNSLSKAAAGFTLTGATGGQFRIRGDFNRASTDTTNANGDSAWNYFVVVT